MAIKIKYCIWTFYAVASQMALIILIISSCMTCRMCMLKIIIISMCQAKPRLCMIRLFLLLNVGYRLRLRPMATPYSVSGFSTYEYALPGVYVCTSKKPNILFWWIPFLLNATLAPIGCRPRWLVPPQPRHSPPAVAANWLQHKPWSVDHVRAMNDDYNMQRAWPSSFTAIKPLYSSP